VTQPNVYGGVNRANRRRELDRRTWADRELHVFTFDRGPTPTAVTATVDFLTVFEGQPLFHWAVELREDSVPLIAGSFPSVNASVALWTTTGPEPEEGGVTLYSGATISTITIGNSGYLYTFRFGFEGVVFKNVSTLR
jgi:hypothetical protein